MSKVETETVVTKVSDGTEMLCYVARPFSSPKTSDGHKVPCLLVFPEIFGVNHHIQDVAQRFAKEGYLTIAPEIFHRTAPQGWEGDYKDFSKAMPHANALTREMLVADIEAAYRITQEDPQGDKFRVAAVGYCMGGRLAFLANATVPLKAGISYYGGGIAQGMLSLVEKQSGPLLFFWGGLDKHIPPEQTRAVNDALRKANKPFVDVVISYADHAFFCDARPAYNDAAAKESWALTLSFLKSHV